MTADLSDILHGTQAACFWAARHLVTETHRITGEPLPLLTWVVGADKPQLTALAVDEADVRTWANHLRLQTTTPPEEQPELVVADGFAHGIPVRIWMPRPMTATTREA